MQGPSRAESISQICWRGDNKEIQSDLSGGSVVARGCKVPGRLVLRLSGGHSLAWLGWFVGRAGEPITRGERGRARITDENAGTAVALRERVGIARAARQSSALFPTCMSPLGNLVSQPWSGRCRHLPALRNRSSGALDCIRLGVSVTAEG
jgi:hypothetical protein